MIDPTDLPNGQPVAEKLTLEFGKYKFWRKGDQLSSKEIEGGEPFYIDTKRVYPIDQDPHDVKFDGSVVDADIIVDNEGNIIQSDAIAKRQITADKKRYAQMTGDGDDFIFYHYGDKLDIIDPEYVGGSSQMSAGEPNINTSFYYTSFDKPQTKSINMVRVPKKEVYDADLDHKGFVKEAEARFHDVTNNVPFNGMIKTAWIAKIANEHGYKMIVADGLNAQTTLPLRTEKPMIFSPNTGWSSEYISKSNELEKLYDVMRESSRDKVGDVYNKVPFAEFYKLSQDDITTMIMTDMSLPKKYKDQYLKILNSDEVSKSVKVNTKQQINIKPSEIRVRVENNGAQLAKKVSESFPSGSTEHDIAESFLKGEVTIEQLTKTLAGSDKISESTRQILDVGSGMDYGRDIDPDYRSPDNKQAFDQAAEELSANRTASLHVTPEMIASSSSIDREPQYKPENVPVLSLSEIVNKARGNIIFTSSDMSKEGSITLPNGESIESVQPKYSAGESPVTITSIKNPHEMLGNDNAVKYVVSGIETLFANKWLSDKELHDHIMGVFTSKKAFNDLNISEKHWKEIISQLDKIKTHKELGDWLTKASFPVRKIITSSLLEGLNKDTFVNDNARKEFVIGRISGNNTQKGELPPGAIAGLMEYAGKNGRGFSQKDFFESTSKEEYYNAWLKHGLNKGEFGLLVGGFISPADIAPPEKKPFMLDKYYSLNNPGTMDVKYQKASKEDEVRIKEIADQYSELPQIGRAHV